MKITILVENLSRGLTVVGRCVASRPQLPILSNVLLKAVKGGVEFLATDLEMSLRVKVEAKVDEEGEMCLPAKPLMELVATLRNRTVELAAGGEVVEVSTEGVKARLNTVGAGEFPAVPAFKGAAGMILEGEALRRSLSKVAVSASRDDSRPVFTGVLWQVEGERLRLVATDGYRLGIDELSVGKDVKLKKTIIPVRAVGELLRIAEKEGGQIEVRLEEDKQQVIFRMGQVELTSRLLAGEFPPYQQILPSSSKTKVEFNREELMEGVKRAAIFAQGGASVVRCEILEGGCQIGAEGKEVGSAQTRLSVVVEGEPMMVAFNSRYLLEGLGGLETETVEFSSEGSLKPGVFREVGKGKSDFIQMIMPVRVQE